MPSNVTINFKALDIAPNPITLSGFAFSTDNGATWTTPVNGDDSEALSANWSDNSYSSGEYQPQNMSGTAAEWNAATSYSFSFNQAHADVPALKNYDCNIQFRLYVNNGKPTSSNDPVQTETVALPTPNTQSILFLFLSIHMLNAYGGK